MALNIDPNSVFPTYELLEPKNIDSDNLAQESTSSLFVTQPEVGNVTVTDGILDSVSINSTANLNGKFFTAPPAVTSSLGGSQTAAGQTNSTGTITVLSKPANVDKTVSLGNIGVSIATKAALASAGQADSSVDIVWDTAADSAITGVAATPTTYSAAISTIKTGDAITIQIGSNSTTLTEGSSNDFTDNATLQSAIENISGVSSAAIASGTLTITLDTESTGAQPIIEVTQTQTNDAGKITAVGAGNTQLLNAGIADLTGASAAGSTNNDATFDVTFDGTTGAATVTVATGGTGYAAAETLTIAANSAAGGTLPAADVTFNVSSVEGSLIPSAFGANAPESGTQGNQFAQQVTGGDVEDSVAAQIANVINSKGALADYRATSSGAVVTVEYTGTNGTNPNDILGNAITLTKNGSWCSLSSATLASGTVAVRKPEISATVVDGVITGYSVDDAGSGLTSSPTFSITAPDTEAIEKIAAAGADIATGGATFSYDKKYIAVGLSDLVVGSSSSNPNSLTEVEASEAGDMRKICYHLIRRFYDYLNEQNSIISITIANAGLNYTTADTIEVSGGGQSSAYSFNITVDANGAITGVTYSGKSHLTGAVASDATNVGKGFTSTPTVVISSSTGSGATASAVLTDNIPSKFSVGRSGISENVVTGELSRTYQANFTFNESGLEVSNEA